MTRHSQFPLHARRTKFANNRFDGDGTAHAAHHGKLFASGQGKRLPLLRISTPCDNTAMGERAFSDIAERIKWHRETVEGLDQKAYAERIGVKRTTLKNWETGDYRLSLDGALAMRSEFDLSLDFMYEGIDDALPMTLRQAWRDRSLVKNSK